MDNKILIELIIPEIDRTLNVYIPINLRFGNVLNLINKSIDDITSGLYSKNDNCFYDEKGAVLNLDMYVYNSTIRSGSRIILL